jgi:hypothetical protein
VILCTGYSKKISDETASEIGINAFAYKPVAKATLAKMVRKVLDEGKRPIKINHPKVEYSRNIKLLNNKNIVKDESDSAYLLSCKYV